MSYDYKDHEIFARCHIQGSDLFEIDENGTPTKSADIFIEHEEDRTVVWYEIDDESGEQYKTLDLAKQQIDKRIKESENDD